MLRNIFNVLFFLSVAIQTYAQTCSIIAPLKNCLGDPISFKFTSAWTPVSWLWDFNGEGSSTVANPVFIFNTPGTKKITVKITQTSGSSTAVCTEILNIVVNEPPVWKVKLDTAQSFLCLQGNRICIKDESQRGHANVPIRQRVVVWGDGAYDVNSTPETDRSDCHSYAKVGYYDITVEITDSNGCKKSGTFQVFVAKTLEALFSYNVTRYCDSTKVCFVNASDYDQALSTKFYWIIDGVVDSSKSAGICKTFTSDAQVNAALRISNKYCVDTASQSFPVKSGVKIPYITANKHRACINDATFKFTVTGLNNATYEWKIRDSSKFLAGNPVNSGLDSFVTLPMPGLGKWYVEASITEDMCTRKVIDSVYVVGATAGFTLSNSLQCTSLDTVYACPSIKLYQTVQNNLKFIWSFGDSYGPQCTSAVGASNCNWQTILNGARHKYSKDTCYSVRLQVFDTVNLCQTDQAAVVSIGKPSLATLGYQFVSHCYIPGSKASSYAYVFEPKEVKPACGVSNIYLNTDSARTNIGFKPISMINAPYYVYDSVRDPDGWVSLGVIVEQGSQFVATGCSGTPNSIDRRCSDTFWYHKEFRLLPEPRSAFYVTKTLGCKPLSVTATLYEATQKFIRMAIWDWGDGFYDTTYYSPGYVSISARNHTYGKSGIFWLTLILENENGCRNSFSHKMTVGHQSIIKSDTVQCRTALLNAYIEYWGAATGFWNKPERAADGKENLWWDFGDGSTGTGNNQTHYYPLNGTYLIKLISKDSLACYDTIYQNLHIVGPKAGIRAPLITSVCNEIISFYDSSQKMGTHFFDSIVSWFWDFGDLKNPSILKDATHAYSNFGSFTITHIVTNRRGCEDTTKIQIVTIGPRPSFIIDGDSDGCQPFTVTLKSTSDSSTISDYIWKPGDPDSTIISLQKDSSISFTYTEPGVYYPNLTGAKSVKSPTTGNTYYCVARYPDPPLHPKLKVTVWPRPQVDFEMPDTVCPGSLVTLEDKSDTTYKRYRWQISNGDSIYSLTRIVSWTSADTGHFRFFYAPEFDPVPPAEACFDTASKLVYVSPVFADFNIDTSKTEDPIFHFKNLSRFADKYYWDFGHPSSSQNISFELHPGHNYDPDTGNFTVCLRAINSIGCEDTVCKEIPVKFFPFVFYYNVFTPGNLDGSNDEFDIDINGETAYDLKIYNRWGMLVYQSSTDAEAGEKKNWNGRMFNTGEECPAGTYFYVFNYRILQRQAKVVNGTITLIR